MKHIALFAQVATLTMSWSSNRADAMAAAAIFAVLCVVVVLIKSTFRPKRNTTCEYETTERDSADHSGTYGRFRS